MKFYQVGDIVEGIVTGVKPYGAFICIDANNQGLVHISEISHEYVSDISKLIKVNEKIKVKILAIDEKNYQMRLSIKALGNRRMRRYNTLHQKVMMPESKIGFKTLKEQLPIWLKQVDGGKDA